MPVPSRIDEVLKIFQSQIETSGALKTAEPLMSAAATGLSGGLAVLSIQFGEETFAILGLTAPENALQAAGIPPEEANIIQTPDNLVEVKDPAVAKQVLSLIEKLEELDDTQAVYSNFDASPEILESIHQQ